MSDKWWNLDEGLTEGFSPIPHTLLSLLMDSKALTPSEVNVLTCLVRQTFGIQGRQAVRASAKQIAAASNLNAKTVQDALRTLEEKGHVTIEREKGSASLIRLNFEAIRPEKTEGKRSRKNQGPSTSIAQPARNQAHEEAQLRKLDELLGMD